MKRLVFKQMVWTIREQIPVFDEEHQVTYFIKRSLWQTKYTIFKPDYKQPFRITSDFLEKDFTIMTSDNHPLIVSRYGIPQRGILIQTGSLSEQRLVIRDSKLLGRVWNEGSSCHIEVIDESEMDMLVAIAVTKNHNTYFFIFFLLIFILIEYFIFFN